jgi:Fur family zinc uptake transcriptional regulator
MSGDNLIESAEKYCLDNSLRLTSPRLYVLSILVKAKEPMGAYGILEALGQYIDNPKPPTAYRAIDFWREHGFVHKIESLNAFMTCCEDHDHRDPHFLVCDGCHSVQELHSPEHNHQNAKNLPTGFVPTRTFTETHGICGACEG